MSQRRTPRQPDAFAWPSAFGSASGASGARRAGPELEAVLGWSARCRARALARERGFRCPVVCPSSPPSPPTTPAWSQPPARLVALRTVGVGGTRGEAHTAAIAFVSGGRSGFAAVYILLCHTLAMVHHRLGVAPARILRVRCARQNRPDLARTCPASSKFGRMSTNMGQSCPESTNCGPMPAKYGPDAAVRSMLRNERDSGTLTKQLRGVPDRSPALGRCSSVCSAGAHCLIGTACGSAVDRFVLLRGGGWITSRPGSTGSGLESVIFGLGSTEVGSLWARMRQLCARFDQPQVSRARGRSRP